MAKTEKLFSKIVMIIFLVLIVLGFTIPGFINNSSTGAIKAQTEPRLCKSDADCYLTCDDQPLRVLCLQNLCQQNECGDSYFLYDSKNPVTFELEIGVDTLSKEKISLKNRTISGNFFVEFLDNDQVKIYSQRLSLNVALDQAGMSLVNNCLQFDAAAYCTDTTNSLITLINGEEVVDSGSYIPNEGDKISILYQTKDRS